ncbi:MAG: REP-associated tyrosine transposase [Candidatus Acidiferrales bacterium]
MGRLRHRTAPSWTYFVTTKAWQNRPVFQATEGARILIECMLRYRDAGAYLFDEFVVMPNHLHVILTPSAETSLEKAIMLIKGGSSHEIHGPRGTKSQLWASGFHESRIRDYGDYLAKVSYVRNNPVEAGLVGRAEEWPYGSASGAFRMDGLPPRLPSLSSGAKAPAFAGAGNVGAKAPTPENARCDRAQSHRRRKSLAIRERTPKSQPPEEYLL